MAKGYHPSRRSSDPIPERNNNYSGHPSTGSYMNSSQRGLILPFQNMAIPIYRAPPSREEVELGGRVLFEHFIQEELVHQGISEEILETENLPPDAFGDVGPEIRHIPSPVLASIPDGYKNAHFIRIGQNIRQIANQFAASHERSLIQQQADEVDLSHINVTTFHHLLQEVFKKGLDNHSIIAVFFFCSDVLIRCIKNQLHNIGSKLFFWTLDYLLQHICQWVFDHGGWEKVFGKVYSVLFKVSCIAFFGVSIACGIAYLQSKK